MTKIFKQLARHWAVCLVVFALLFVQAYCDLSLPDYTSKIVDTGIQQGGIDTAGLKNLEYLYKSYHALGGNGTGTELYNRAKALPIRD